MTKNEGCGAPSGRVLNNGSSAAVGIIAQFLTPDGNKGSVTKGAWVDLLKGHNGHITLLVEAGDPFFDIRTHLAKSTATRRLFGCSWCFGTQHLQN